VEGAIPAMANINAAGGEERICLGDPLPGIYGK
jgi:hypothetical protein